MKNSAVSPGPRRCRRPAIRLAQSPVRYLIGRMINNGRLKYSGGLLLSSALAQFCAAGCKAAEPEGAPRLSGVVEFDEKVLSFELAGRVLERPVERGDVVKPGQRLALLDDTLESASRSARQSELSAAEARVALLEAGPKREDIGALAAQVEAARAAEKRIAENLERERRLAERGVTPAAVVNDLSRDLERAKAERGGLEAQLASQSPLEWSEANTFDELAVHLKLLQRP